jgi:type I restriction enzyme S subunit
VISAFAKSPDYWRAIPLKRTVSDCANGTWGEEPRGGPDDLVCVRVADFDRQRLRVDLGNPTQRFVPSGYRRGRMLQPGDLLVEKSGGGDGQPVGTVVLYDGGAPAVCSNFIARMPVVPGFDAQYLCYLHAALYRLGVNRRSISQTTGIQNLDSKSYLEEVVRIPEFVEQRRIAAHLDSKTSGLDSVVDVKHRLLGLLRERREALITQTMSRRGDSSRTRFNFIRSGALLYGANEPADSRAVEYPRYIRITDLNDDGSLREDTFHSLPEHLAAPYLLQDGDLLLARSGATVGKAFRYRSEWGRACFAGYLIRLRPDRRKILPDYLHYFTQSHTYRDQVKMHTVQSTIANVSAERYGNFEVSLPPLEQQQAIVDSLNASTKNLDRLSSVTERQLSLLREYRSALIVDAVTRGL